MFLTKLFHFLGGYLVISVEGQYPERFLNVCAKRHILIWDLVTEGGKMRCSISNRGFCLLPDIVKKTGVTVKILEKHGLPMLLGRLWKRKGFLIGVGSFLLLFVGLNQFIWKIEIVGCETISPKAVMAELNAQGLKLGAFRPFLDEKALQNQVLIKMPELAWLWADKSGSKVIVQVKERVPVPEMFDPNDFCNLVAKKDGVLTDMTVRAGVPMVSIGDSVAKGDILVSGLIVSEKGVAPRQVQSDGVIMARVFYEKNKAFSLWQEKRQATGERETKVTLHLFGWDLGLYLKKEPSFSEFSEEHQDFELSLFGKYLGLGASRQVFSEEEVILEKMTAESVVDQGVREILQEIEEETGANSKKLDSRFTHQLIDEDTVEINLVAEYLEDIGEKMRP